jgi:hypothetical protein
MTNFPQDLYLELAAFIESRPKISTHCHQLPVKEYLGFDLESLLRNSYINWCGVPWDHTINHHNLLEKALQLVLTSLQKSYSYTVSLRRYRHNGRMEWLVRLLIGSIASTILITTLKL